jgi:adenylate cyclase
LSVLVDMHNQKHIAENVLIAYLGPQTGPRVLAGQIRRGSGEAIAAVLWSSDLRGFTKLSDHVAGEEIIGILDRVFDGRGRAIYAVPALSGRSRFAASARTDTL